MSEFSDLRLRAKLSIGGASEFLGVCERTIYRYEKGESRPRPRELQAMRGLCSHLPQLPLEVAQPGSAFTFIDLFAGIGGLRAGFEAAGGQCVFTSEWDRYSRKTYAANFLVNHEFGGDIREYSADPERVPEHDVLLAGFPCQPFSIAGVSKKNSLGRPHGFLCDTQGTLFFDLAQILHHRRPAAFMLENVKNLERHDQGKTFATILNVLRNELRYEVHTRVINSEPWVPQRRERVFIVGFREKSGFNFDELKVPLGPGPKLGSILEEQVDPKYTLTTHLWEYLKSSPDAGIFGTRPGLASRGISTR